MSSMVQSNKATWLAGGSVAKGQAVKLSSGSVVACDAVTDRAIGVAQNAASSGQPVEVALPGGGGVALAKASISAGNLLGINADGSLQKVDAADSIVIAQAHEDAAAGDIFGVMIIGPFQATATQS